MGPKEHPVHLMILTRIVERPAGEAKHGLTFPISSVEVLCEANGAPPKVWFPISVPEPHEGRAPWRESPSVAPLTPDISEIL